MHDLEFQSTFENAFQKNALRHRKRYTYHIFHFEKFFHDRRHHLDVVPCPMLLCQRVCRRHVASIMSHPFRMATTIRKNLVFPSPSNSYSGRQVCRYRQRLILSSLFFLGCRICLRRVVFQYALKMVLWISNARS